VPATRPQPYKGYLLTPQSFQLTNALGGRKGLWSIGVFIRTVSQSVTDNRYFGMSLLAAKSRRKAYDLGLKFGRRLVERDLLQAITEVETAN
jgi:hypothetical protein